MEGSGSVPLTNGSEWPKILRILLIRIQKSENWIFSYDFLSGQNVLRLFGFVSSIYDVQKLYEKKNWIFAIFTKMLHFRGKMLTFWRNILHSQMFAYCWKDFAFFRHPTSCFLAASLLALLLSARTGCAAFAAAFVAGANFAVVAPLAAPTAALPLPARRSVLNHLQKYIYFWTILGSFFTIFFFSNFLCYTVGRSFSLIFLAWFFRTKFEFEPKSCNSR